MDESKIDIRFKRKIIIVRDQNIFDSDLYYNCVNTQLPLKVRIGYSIAMIDIYSEILEYFISCNESYKILFNENGDEPFEKKESIHFNRIQYLELYKQKTELQFIRFIRKDLINLESELNNQLRDGLLSA